MESSKKEAAKDYSVRVTENALQNIDDITGYIAFINHQPLNSIRVGDAIYETIDRIELNPYIFRECEEIPTINKIYRKAVCQSWLIIFRVKTHDIVIIGVIHGSRNPSKVRALRKIK